MLGPAAGTYIATGKDVMGDTGSCKLVRLKQIKPQYFPLTALPVSVDVYLLTLKLANLNG